MCASSNPDLLRKLFNCPYGVHKETLDRVMTVQRMQVAQEKAREEFMRLALQRDTLLRRIQRYLKKQRKAKRGRSVADEMNQAPQQYLAELKNLENLIDELTKKMVELYKEIEMLTKKIAEVKAELVALNDDLTADIATYEKDTSVEIMDLFGLDPSDPDLAIYFSPDPALKASSFSDIDIDAVVDVRQKAGFDVSKKDVMRVLNMYGGVQQKPTQLEALGLPEMKSHNTNDVAELVGKLCGNDKIVDAISVFNKHDAKCTKRLEVHAQESAEHQADMDSMVSRLDSAKETLQTYQTELEGHERAYENISRKLPTPKPAMSSKKRDDEEKDYGKGFNKK